MICDRSVEKLSMDVDDNASTSERMNISGNDTSSALYVHPSDNPGMILVPTQFDGAGYRSWRRGVMRALLVKSKLSFIDGTCKRPKSQFTSFKTMAKV